MLKERDSHLFSKPWIEVLSRCLMLVLLTFALSEMFVLKTGRLPPKADLLLRMCYFVTLAFFLFPQNALSRLSSLGAMAMWGLASLLSVIILLSITTMANLYVLAISSIAVTIVLMLMMSIVQLLKHLFNSHSSVAPLLTFVSFVVISAVPVWLGLWAEYAVDGEYSANILIAMSPLSYFSVMLDYDYLRSAWFYQNTPFGALRFDYLSPVYYSFLLLASTFVILVLSHLLEKKELISNLFKKEKTV